MVEQYAFRIGTRCYFRSYLLAGHLCRNTGGSFALSSDLHTELHLTVQRFRSHVKSWCQNGWCMETKPGYYRLISKSKTSEAISSRKSRTTFTLAPFELLGSIGRFSALCAEAVNQRYKGYKAWEQKKKLVDAKSGGIRILRSERSRIRREMTKHRSRVTQFSLSLAASLIDVSPSTIQRYRKQQNFVRYTQEKINLGPEFFASPSRIALLLWQGGKVFRRSDDSLIYQAISKREGAVELTRSKYKGQAVHRNKSVVQSCNDLDDQALRVTGTPY